MGQYSGGFAATITRSDFACEDLKLTNALRVLPSAPVIDIRGVLNGHVRGDFLLHDVCIRNTSKCY